MQNFLFYPRGRFNGFMSNKEQDMEANDIEIKEVKEEEQTNDQPKRKIVLSSKSKKNGRTK
jgi:hypothetical protein